MQSTKFKVTDIFGKAINDYQAGKYREDIRTFSSLNEEDIIPIPYLFRDFENMPLLEQKALQCCSGDILDIGCGAGSHSLYLQENSFSVTGLDSSKRAIDTCAVRGLKKTVHSDILKYNGTKFDTLLLLMNGIGIVGKIEKLDVFFEHLKSLLNQNGQILLDSSDIIYMFQRDDDGAYWVPDTSNYYGEVEFTITYKGEKSAPFYWLYLDYDRLSEAANRNDLFCELVSEGEHYDYLARLSLK